MVILIKKIDIVGVCQLKIRLPHNNGHKQRFKTTYHSNWIIRLIEDSNSRLQLIMIIMVIGLLVIFFTNNVFTQINTSTWTFENIKTFPFYPPVGNDFRVGYYWPARYLISSHFSVIGPNGSYPSNYPPLVALSSLPYALFDSMTAYQIHAALLILANLACIWMAVWMVNHFLFNKFGENDLVRKFISILLFSVISIYIFTSYFFAYSFERGNTDILALFYSMLAMVVLIKRPNNVWLQVILLSVAVHFKIYPAILFALLLFKHGKKLIIPAIVVNTAFLLILGPNMALSFLQNATSDGEGVGLGNAWSNVGNHAAYSFTIGIDRSGTDTLTGTFFILWAIAMLVPLLIWGISVIALVLKKYSIENAIYFFMISIPPMSLIPTVSMDYKLVILGAGIVLLFGLILKQSIHKFSWFDIVQVLLLIGILLMMHRSYAFTDKSLFVIRDKYVWVLAIELLMGINILRNQKVCYQTITNISQPSTSV